MKISFQSAVISWRGPAPYYFVPIPEAQSKKIKAMAAQLTYGWGVIPVGCKIGKTEFSTALIPRQDFYYLPIKNQVRFAEELEEGSKVSAVLTLGS